MQIPYRESYSIPYLYMFVWRRPEFAFLCADFGRRTFLFAKESVNQKSNIGGYFNKKIFYRYFDLHSFVDPCFLR